MNTIIMGILVSIMIFFAYCYQTRDDVAEQEYAYLKAYYKWDEPTEGGKQNEINNEVVSA